MSGPLADLSVVVPVYNAAPHLGDLTPALEHVLARGAQVVLVDDASSDGSAEQLSDWARGRRGLVWLPQPSNSGVAASRNLALRHIDRTFVWFLDADDLWDADLPERLVEAARDAGADVAVTGARIQHVSGGGFDVDVTQQELTLDARSAVRGMLRGEIHGYLWNKVFRRAVVADLEFPRWRTQSDFPFVFGALASAARVVWIPGLRYSHVLRPGSLSQGTTSHDANLRRCVDVVASDPVVERWGLSADLRYFQAWFHHAAGARAIVNATSDPARRIEELHELRSSVGLRSILDVARRRPSAALRLLVLRLAPGLAPILATRPGGQPPHVFSDIRYGYLVGARDLTVFGRKRRRAPMLTSFVMGARSAEVDAVLTSEGLRTSAGLVLLGTLLTVRRQRKLVLSEFLPGTDRPALVRWGYRLALRRSLLSAQVMTAWEAERYAHVYRIPRERFSVLPFYGRDDRSNDQPLPLTARQGYVMASGRNSFDLETVRLAAHQVQARVVVVCSARAAREVSGPWPAHAEILTDIPREQHDALLGGASVYLLVSRDEGRSAGHVRLMSCATRGTPVVATAVPGIEGYEHLALRVVPPGDPGALAAAAQAVLSDLEGAMERESQIVKGAMTYSDYERSISRWLRRVTMEGRSR